MSALVPVTCARCGTKALVSYGAHVIERLTTIRCGWCGLRQLRVDVPDERPTSPELPEAS